MLRSAWREVNYGWEAGVNLGMLSSGSPATLPDTKSVYRVTETLQQIIPQGQRQWG